MLPHFNPLRPISNYVEDGPKNHLYCGHCLSDNMKVYEGNGSWKHSVYQDDKLECLDCGWKGGPNDCKLMSKKTHDKNFLYITRLIKINKIRKRCLGQGIK